MLVPSNRRMINQMMSDPFEGFFGGSTSSDHPTNGLMKTDVKETETGFVIDVELPGAQKEDVTADIKDGYLTITATTKRESEEGSGSYIRKERFEGQCKRTFYVGEEIDEDAIKAGFENGILTINVPKMEQPKIEESKSIFID